ncbi:hypothetical protein KKF91_20865 [Myxococcota bacterium]|nr:hypothetical protein [Myxococcota bacterium]
MITHAQRSAATLRLSRRARLVLALAALGCEAPLEATPQLQTHTQALNAFCEVSVNGQGVLEMETDYLPHVITCENGRADFEALKAQAVSARSYAYYKLNRNESLTDGQGDQVYSCAASPQAQHFQAVAETAGQVLRYENTYVAAFYVAGAIPSTQSCVPAAADSDPTNTERYVTYNEGRAGDNLEQTSLGWISPGNYANRGCMSQNGSHCLAERGWGYVDILQFYYGADIILEQTEGRCVGDVEPPPPLTCEALPEGGGIIDEQEPCFTKHCRTGDWWWGLDTGWSDHAWYTNTVDDAEFDCAGEWQIRVARPGWYDVEVYLLDGQLPLSERARYVVEGRGAPREIHLRQEGRHGWISLGVFEFDDGAAQRVSLFDNTGEPYGDDSPKLIFDALRLTPADPPIEPPVDAALPPQDAAIIEDARPIQDAAAPPRPDAAVTRPDAAIARPDAAVTRPDAAIARPDAAIARPDAITAPLDAAPLDAAPWAPLRDEGLNTPDAVAYGQEGYRVRQTAQGCQQGANPNAPWGLLALYTLLSWAYRSSRRSAIKV